jgi:hypothetical protein
VQTQHAVQLAPGRRALFERLSLAFFFIARWFSTTRVLAAKPTKGLHTLL